ncbi:hypothetical protein AF333_20960 [Aneurinibacillus migulanus]|uniref:Pirin family protein n=2 Tax=Aneurinibacillus migulanus TaxID=47500 RepID=A0A0M0H663_ANEMI|nr:hypothetical protein AF333_20960 [Aneurinibacillus migulanus]
MGVEIKMIKVITKEGRYKPFDPLRIFDIDIIQPGQGFGMHPHANREIVTYVIDGTLEHQDNLGNKVILEAGGVQRITAGTGIFHSECNRSKDKPVHLLQIWFLPTNKGLPPSWEQKRFTKEQQRNQLFPIVSGTPLRKALHINQDIIMYVSYLETGKAITFTQEEGRRIFLFVMEGELTLNRSMTLNRHNSARVTETSTLEVTTNSGTHFMLIDLP